MATILSLQSHVAYGYVGNRAATFPLQRLGHEVISINTVQFSNHTNYQSWSGDIMSIEHIESIFMGLMKLGALNNLDAVLTGYLGDQALGVVLIKWLTKLRAAKPSLIYCCDPVIGDICRGVFVQPGVGEFFAQQAIDQANILTPNQFELQYLTGITINTLQDAQTACAILHQHGVQHVLVTSLIIKDAPLDTIAMLLASQEQCYLVTTPQVAMPIAATGAGDLTAALFLAKYLETHNLPMSLAHTAAAVYAVFVNTFALNRSELALIQSQEQLVNPTYNFPVELIG